MTAVPPDVSHPAPRSGAAVGSGHPGVRLDPGLRSRDFLHLAPLSAIVRDAVRTQLAGEQLRVLDLGCGMKPYAPVFEGRCREYIGLDITRSTAAEVLAVGSHLPFRDSAFDVVLCTQVLEHDPEPQGTVDEAHRVLATGGLLILSTHGVWFKHGEADYWRWTDAGLRQVMHAFASVEVRNCGGQYSALFQLLNLYSDPVPVGRRLLYLVNNVLGVALDRILPADNLIANYVVLAKK